MNGFCSRTCFCFWSALLSWRAISRQAASPTGCRLRYRTIGPAVSCFSPSCSLSPHSSTISPRHSSARRLPGMSSRTASASATSRRLSPLPTPAAPAASSATRRRRCCGSRASAPFPCFMPMSRLGCAVRLGHPGIACPTEIRADRQGSADRPAHFVSARCRGHRRARLGDRRQCRGASARRPYSRRTAPDRACGRCRHIPDGPDRAAGLVGRSPGRTRRALSPRSRLRGVDDARQIPAAAKLGDNARARLRLGRVRQYSADRARHKAGQL